MSCVVKVRLELEGRVDCGGNMMGERSTPTRLSVRVKCWGGEEGENSLRLVKWLWTSSSHALFMMVKTISTTLGRQRAVFTDLRHNRRTHSHKRHQ